MNLSDDGMRHMHWIASKALVPRGKLSFIHEIPRNGRLLDVGCGNNSPSLVKTRRPDIFYCGIDVGDYNQSIPVQDCADQYILTTAESFASRLSELKGEFDAIISSHNLEHCCEPQEVLEAMLQALKAGGRIYMSFPCEESISFPSRSGCLNFYDDTSHKYVPSYESILGTLNLRRFSIEFSTPRHRPFLPLLLGFLLEPVGKRMKRNMPFGSTWAYYGFESVIWARNAG